MHVYSILLLLLFLFFFFAARSLLVTLQFGKSRFIAFQNRFAMAHDRLRVRGGGLGARKVPTPLAKKKGKNI